MVSFTPLRGGCGKLPGVRPPGKALLPTMSDTMTLQIWLVRHGKTVFNTMGRLQGWSDAPLTPEGIAGARAFGQALGNTVMFDRAFCSTSPRTLETARHILAAKGQPGLPPLPIEALREYFFGGWEGERMQTACAAFAARNGVADAPTWLETYRAGTSSNLMIENVHATDPLKLAETEQQFTSRLQRGMEQLLAASQPGERVLLVCHGMAITAILKRIDATRVPYRSIQHAFAVRLEFEGGHWRLPEQEILYA